MAPNTIQTGDMFSNQINKMAEIGIIIVFRVIPTAFPMLKRGAAIRATTAGRMPLKMLSTVGFSLKVVNTMAISKMIINEGNALPKDVIKLPLKPLIL